MKPLNFVIKPTNYISGSRHFRWHEFLRLPQWGIYTFPTTPAIVANIQRTAWKLDEIRSILGDKPIMLTSGFRPYIYNNLIGGAPKSLHTAGLAADFYVEGMTVHKVHSLLYPRLEDLNICMENISETPTWTHIDLGEPRYHSGRYFNP